MSPLQRPRFAPPRAPVAVFLLAGCAPQTSWLAGAGTEARAVEALFWPFMVGAAVIWAGVMALALYAARYRARSHSEEAARRLIFWGGVVFPTAVVLGLLVAGLLTMKGLRSGPAEVTVLIDGEQWWWRVVYEAPDGARVESANELRLPAGRPVEILLTSDDVIHSFWVPAIAGKLDLIPGRTNRMTLTATRTGRFGGLCAEFCGEAHAQMTFAVEVMEPDAFDAWVAEGARAAGPEAEGLDAFLAAGCGACHTIRGTPAQGRVGPDLTRLGGRATIGAGILPMEPAALRRWIAETEAVKPGVRMPSYPMLGDRELDLIAGYLAGLR